jgi:enoyl-[acyl-carrier protein] reductase I
MGLLDGKQGLVIGIANERSYAFHMAKAITEHGGQCAFTHLPGDKNRSRGAAGRVERRRDFICV